MTKLNRSRIAAILADLKNASPPLITSFLTATGEERFVGVEHIQGLCCPSPRVRLGSVVEPCAACGQRVDLAHVQIQEHQPDGLYLLWANIVWIPSIWRFNNPLARKRIQEWALRCWPTDRHGLPASSPKPSLAIAVETWWTTGSAPWAENDSGTKIPVENGDDKEVPMPPFETPAKAPPERARPRPGQRVPGTEPK